MEGSLQKAAGRAGGGAALHVPEALKRGVDLKGVQPVFYAAQTHKRVLLLALPAEDAYLNYLKMRHTLEMSATGTF